jgi:hypothetical protein
MTKRSRIRISNGFSLLMAGTLLAIGCPTLACADAGESELTAGTGKSAECSTSDTDTERDQATESVLDSLVLDFAFGDHKPFKQVLGELSAQTGLQFILNQTAEDGDLTRETEIEFSAESLRLRTGLAMLLDKYNATFVIRDGLVVIISLEAASDPAYFRRKMFDVENLLQLMIRTQGIKDRVYMVPAEMVRPRIYPDGLGRAVIGSEGEPGWPGGSGMFAFPLIGQEADLTPRAQVGGAAAGVDEAGATVPRESAAGTQEPATAKAADETVAARSEGQSTGGLAKVVPVTYSARQIAGELLVDLVQTQVCPDEWADTGNGDGVIQVVGGVLVVSQTEDALNQVGSMLREMESKLGAIDSRSKGDGGQFAK